MNGKESHSIQLPKEIIKAERARSNKLLIVAVVVSNLLLYLIIKDSSSKEESEYTATRKEYSTITLKVDNYVPEVEGQEQKVSLMKENRIIAHNCFLKECRGERCTLEVPSYRVYSLMKSSSLPIKLIPRVQKIAVHQKRSNREFTI